MIFSSFFICHFSLSVVDLLISVLYTQIERSFLSISTRHAPLLLVGCKCVLRLGQALRQKRFSKIASCTFKGAVVRAATRGNPDWSSVYRCRLSRDSEGDGSGHYESGGVMSPPSPVPSAPLNAMIMCISSVKLVLWLVVNLHHLLSDGAAFTTQSRSSLTSYAISRPLSAMYRLRLWERYCVACHLKAGDGDLLLITEPALLTRCAWS